MLKDDGGGDWNRQRLADFRVVQEEMLNLSREYSRARLMVWAEETRSLRESWTDYHREWQGGLDSMASLAASRFEEVAARGEAASNLLGQSWEKTLAGISGGVEEWGEQVLGTLGKVASAWMATLGGGGGSGGGGTPFLAAVLDFGGWFHQGGVVEAHQGLVVSPGTLMGDEQLVLAQAGEGILPRESMARLGEGNFEALRSGRFEVSSGSGGPRYDITIQVQALDAGGVAGLDWDRLVQRHLLPALERDADRRW
jgi:hypothetical protein